MGHWGVKSYECDEAVDALDAGFVAVHAEVYEDMMEDDNPLTFEQVQAKLASPATLDASIAALDDSNEGPREGWSEENKLGFVGIVVRHLELEIPATQEVASLAFEWLEKEEIEWEEATARSLRRKKELDLLKAVIDRP